MINKEDIDIILICKGWYDITRHGTILNALTYYYHTHYGHKDIVVTEEFALNHFLKPTVIKLIKIKPFLAKFLLCPTVQEINDNSMPISEAMYYRCIFLIQMLRIDMPHLPGVLDGELYNVV